MSIQLGLLTLHGRGHGEFAAHRRIRCLNIRSHLMPKLRWTVPLVAGVAFFVPSVVAAQEVDNSSYVGPDGRRILQQSVVVPASADSVWAAFTTGSGLESFVAPVADIDLKVGGIWEASYDRSKAIGDPGTILNEILSFLPGEMLSVRVVRAPTGFPFPEEIKQVWTVLEFEALGPHEVRVVGTMLGWGEGERWDALYDAFERDNAVVLRRLVRRFVDGPIEWDR